MKIEEGCGCGAALSIEGVTGTVAAVMAYVTDWRKTHHHQDIAKTVTRAIGFALPPQIDDDDD